ncbi:MAG: tetratricopeptide repeat protein, partial [Chloroflexota bacterium]
MQALAAWYLAGAANEWVRPALVEAAVQRARPLFAGLHLPDWVAACDWQANAIPWLRPNAAQAAATLAAVVAKLPAIGGVTWAARCRLSLAYAYLLQEELEAAERTLRLAEESFSDQGQTMDRPRCAYVRIGILRRRGLTRPALALAQETLALCEQMDAVADAARTSLQMGYCHRDLQEEYAAAETSFRRAITLFSAADLPLLVAQAQDGLAQVYQDVGRLAEAAEALAEARLIHDGYPVVVSRAACLVDSGYLELNRGQPAAALDHFQQAGQLYQQFGNQVMVAVVTMYQGEAHQQLGHYQLALSHLEQALERFQELEDPGRRLECQRRLARAWLNLGRPDLAQQLLSQVAAHYQATGQPALQSVILTQQARLFVLEGQLPEAIAYLQKALTAARQAAVQPQVALIQRWLGQVYGQSRRDEEAKEYLTSAAAAFRELAMPVEEAACQVTLGDYWAGRRPAEAETAWRAALELTGALLPEIAWPAWAGLAQLAEEQGDSDQALTAYRSMVGALSSLRQHLHQPSLAGPYLRRPAPALDRAVSLSGRAARPPDAL